MDLIIVTGYLFCGFAFYMFLSIHNIKTHLKRGMSRKDALDAEMKDGLYSELVIMVITILIWPLLMIIKIKVMMLNHIANKKD